MSEFEDIAIEITQNKTERQKEVSYHRNMGTDEHLRNSNMEWLEGKSFQKKPRGDLQSQKGNNRNQNRC